MIMISEKRKEIKQILNEKQYFEGNVIKFIYIMLFI